MKRKSEGKSAPRVYFIKSKDSKIREQLVEMLERDGFSIKDRGMTAEDVKDSLDNDGYYIGDRDSLTKQEIIDSIFPITVNVVTHEYDLLNSVTCAAAAVSILKSPEVFYVYYKGANCSYEEYYNAVKSVFMSCRCGYTEEETEEYFERERNNIRESYEQFRFGRKGVTPEALASSLDLMHDEGEAEFN